MKLLLFNYSMVIGSIYGLNIPDLICWERLVWALAIVVVEKAPITLLQYLKLHKGSLCIPTYHSVVCFSLLLVVAFHFKAIWFRMFFIVKAHATDCTDGRVTDIVHAASGKVADTVGDKGCW